MNTRHEELRAQVKAFHKENPKVWVLFKRFTLELINRGFEHYSAKGVFERIRWESSQAENRGKNDWKLNNNHSAFYARAFMKKFPEHDGFFRTREQISKSGQATKLPPLGPEYFDKAA